MTTLFLLHFLRNALPFSRSTDPGAMPARRPPDWGGSEFERLLGGGNNYDRFEVRFARLQNNFFARFGGRGGNPNNFNQNLLWDLYSNEVFFSKAKNNHTFSDELALPCSLPC